MEPTFNPKIDASLDQDQDGRQNDAESVGNDDNEEDVYMEEDD